MDVFIICAPLVGWLLAQRTITTLKYIGIKQSVREDGPQSHLLKRGTPTMGGLYFLMMWLLSYLFILVFKIHLVEINKFMGISTLFVTFALIGCYDDLTKISAQRGLNMRPKFLLQSVVAILWSLLFMQHHTLHIAGIGVFELSPVVACLWCSFVIIGSANAVNLTDGLDGLMIQTVLVVMCGFLTISMFIPNTPNALHWVMVVLIAMLLALWPMNRHPAKLFLGDTGSLSMGAALAGISLYLHAEFALAIMGLIFVIEACSVAIQIAVFKYSGRRFFRMAPIHHHFELGGWSERQVVAYFTLFTCMTTILGVIWYIRL